MKTTLKKYLLLLLPVSCILLLGIVSVFFLNRPAHVVSQLEVTVAQMPLGISADEADAILGTAPDSISEMDGVLMSPVTMLTASNELSRKYGEPETYSLRVWKRGDVSATVAVDSEGKVAGRWTWFE
ncbi:hypothetical protein [uncultured Gimesia sp.]|uniref:hypothetical protein n=1 Tax=uncultured Gimesia sp. TaxID=1678688 RepID=UPI00260A8D2E|nr:hypothetical protein [uncultured Gimesia sp.]